MKKAILYFLLTMVLLIFGCSSKPVNYTSSLKNSNSDVSSTTQKNNEKNVTKDIRFTPVCSGVLDYSKNEKIIRKDIPNTATVFNDEQEWNNFKNKYLQNINMPDLDFFTKKFILINVMPAKQNYTILDNVIKVTLKGNELNIITDSAGTIKKATDTVYYKTFNLVAVDSELLPENIKINILNARDFDK